MAVLSQLLLRCLPRPKLVKVPANRRRPYLLVFPPRVLLSQLSVRRRSLPPLALPLAAPRKTLASARANICAPRMNNHRLRDPIAFAQLTGRGPQRLVRGRDNATKQFDWRSACLSACV